ncbi:MAG TPA: hypothetical protein VHT92_00525 [Candidatus Cybelea sp.]|nr:hypothetical protein [Candidatus Cybelea sp.]
MKRALTKGDEVILSTGATATVRRSYPQGYSGEVEILLDGSEESERVSGLILPAKPPMEVGSELGDATAAQQADLGDARAPSRRMKD